MSKLHALDEVELHAERVRLLDGDHAVLADLVDGVGDDLADRAVGGRDGGDLGDVALVVDVDLAGLIESTAAATAASMPFLTAIGLAPAATLRQTVPHHRLGEHGGGGGAVTGDVVGLRGDFLDELGAHVLERVLELDLLGDRHTVVGDRGGAELLVEHDVAALGSECDSHRIGELVHPGLESAAGLLVERNLLRHLRMSSVGRVVLREYETTLTWRR